MRGKISFYHAYTYRVRLATLQNQMKLLFFFVSQSFCDEIYADGTDYQKYSG